MSSQEKFVGYWVVHLTLSGKEVPLHACPRTGCQGSECCYSQPRVPEGLPVLAGSRRLPCAALWRPRNADAVLPALVDGQPADAKDRSELSGHHGRTRACGRRTGLYHPLHPHRSVPGKPLMRRAAHWVSVKARQSQLTI